jgi:hypothetical protein
MHLFRDPENVNFLHCEVALARENLLPIESSIIDIASPDVRVTVCVFIAAVRHMDVVTVLKCRAI